MSAFALNYSAQNSRDKPCLKQNDVKTLTSRESLMFFSGNVKSLLTSVYI